MVNLCSFINFPIFPLHFVFITIYINIQCTIPLGVECTPHFVSEKERDAYGGFKDNTPHFMTMHHNIILITFPLAVFIKRHKVQHRFFKNSVNRAGFVLLVTVCIPSPCYEMLPSNKDSCRLRHTPCNIVFRVARANISHRSWVCPV